MNTLVILGALALIFGAAVFYIKISKWIAENADGLTKLVFGLAVVVLILAGIDYFKPDLIPGLRSGIDTIADSIKGFVKPYIS